MNLQRISDFAENQGGRSYLFNKYSKSSEYLHSEVFAQIDSSDGIILDDLVWFAFRQNTTFTNDVSVITNSQSFSNVMVGDEHADLAVS